MVEIGKSNDGTSPSVLAKDASEGSLESVEGVKIVEKVRQEVSKSTSSSAQDLVEVGIKSGSTVDFFKGSVVLPEFSDFFNQTQEEGVHKMSNESSLHQQAQILS